MQTFKVCVLAAAMMLLAAACAPKPPQVRNKSSQGAAATPSMSPFKTYTSKTLGIAFAYPDDYSVRDIPDHDSVLIESAGADIYAFWKQPNPRHLPLSQFFHQEMTPMVYADNENLTGGVGTFYRYTGDVNPYVYIFSNGSNDVVFGFSMNAEPHSVDDLNNFYQILKSIQFVK